MYFHFSFYQAPDLRSQKWSKQTHKWLTGSFYVIMKICFDPVISGKEILGAMRIAIIDDFAPERADIRSAIEKYCGERDFDCEFSEFDSAEALFDAFTPGLFDAVFLDIYMSGVTGIEAAKRLYRLDPECAAALFTSSAAHTLAGYGVHAVGYILKPLRENIPSLYSALDFITARLAKNRAAIDVETEFGVQRLSFRNIVQMNSTGRFAVMRLYGKTVKLCGTYGLYAPLLLADARFLECYNKVIVNMDYIEKRSESGDFITVTGELVPISRRRKSEVLKKYMTYFLARGNL